MFIRLNYALLSVLDSCLFDVLNNQPMTKTDAIAMFGNNASALARAVGLSRSRISQWPDDLTQQQEDRVLGAALRLGKIGRSASAYPPPQRMAG